MASEIRVDKINSLSGVGTVTLSPTGVDIAGITTVATLKATTGIVTTLTATTGIVTTLTTNTLTANSTTKVGSGVTLSPDGDVFATGISTFGDTIKGTAGIFSGAANVSYEALKLVNTQHDTNAQGAAAIKFGITNSLGERNARIEAKEEQNNTNDVGLDFYTNSASGVDTETLKMRVTAAGKVGIGISNPTGQFAVSDGTRTAEINPHSSGTFIGNRSNHDVLFQINAATKAKLDTNGHLTISDGDLVIGTAGHGIDFSATSDTGGMTSELLDDYEEGTWTPGMNNSITLSDAYGRYIKTGHTVHAWFRITFPSTSSSGHVIMQNLPFANTSTEPATGGVARGYQTYDIENGPIYHIGNNNSVLEFYKNAGQNLAASNASTYQFRGCIIYQAA